MIKGAATLMPNAIYLFLLSSLVVKLAVHVLLKSVAYRSQLFNS